MVKAKRWFSDFQDQHKETCLCRNNGTFLEGIFEGSVICIVKFGLGESSSFEGLSPVEKKKKST